MTFLTASFCLQSQKLENDRIQVYLTNNFSVKTTFTLKTWLLQGKWGTRSKKEVEEQEAGLG